MTALPIPAIDHVVINVRDRLDEVAALYERLGFHLTPRGHHTLGSSNNLAILGTDYIELLGVQTGDTRTDVLDWPAGLNGLVFKTLDSDGTYGALAEAGVPVLPPQEFSRPVDMGGGVHGDAAFRTVRLAHEAMPAGRLFFCYHLTPQLVWHDPWRRHQNGAVGLAGALVAAEDPAALGDLFARMFGPDAVRTTATGFDLVAGLATIEVMTPTALTARLGDAAPGAENRAQFMAALVLRTTALDHVRAAVPEATGFEDGLLVPARSAGNTALLFRGVTPRPALLIANAHSRRGTEIGPFITALEAGGLTLRREDCRRREELGPLIRRLRDEVGAVILGGGDGTMNAASTALRETGLPLGILPLGTANDLARTLEIPLEPEAAAAVILAGRTRMLDLGCVNGHPFFNVASLGLSVDITHRLTGLLKRRLGRLAYPAAAAAVITTAGRFHATLSTGGETLAVRTMQIAVGNGRFYGGGMVVEAEAEIDDQQLDVYSLEPRARWRLLLMARAFRAGDHGKLDEVRSMRCREVTVATHRPRDVSADGEIVTRTPARFSLLPQAVRVFVP